MVEIPTVMLLCLFQGLVAGLLWPRTSLKQIEQSSSSGKLRERHTGRPIVSMEYVIPCLGCGVPELSPTMEGKEAMRLRTARETWQRAAASLDRRGGDVGSDKGQSVLASSTCPKEGSKCQESAWKLQQG